MFDRGSCLSILFSSRLIFLIVLFRSAVDTVAKFVCYAEIHRTHMLRLSTEKQFSNSIRCSPEANMDGRGVRGAFHLSARGRSSRWQHIRADAPWVCGPAHVLAGRRSVSPLEARGCRLRSCAFWRQRRGGDATLCAQELTGGTGSRKNEEEKWAMRDAKKLS